MDSFCVILLAIGIACHIFSSALDDIISPLDEYNKRREKKRNEKKELAEAEIKRRLAESDQWEKNTLEELRARDFYRKLYRQIGLNPDTDSKLNK